MGNGRLQEVQGEGESRNLTMNGFGERRVRRADIERGGCAHDAAAGTEKNQAASGASGGGGLQEPWGIGDRAAKREPAWRDGAGESRDRTEIG